MKQSMDEFTRIILETSSEASDAIRNGGRELSAAVQAILESLNQHAAEIEKEQSELKERMKRGSRRTSGEIV